MNGMQKAAVVVGLLAVCASALAAPFRYSGNTGIVGTPGSHPVAGTLYAPIFAAPKEEATEFVDGELTFLRSVELDAGKLALIWGAIGIGVVAWFALASRSTPPQSAAAVSQITCYNCGTPYDSDRTGCHNCGKAKPKTTQTIAR